MAGKCASSDTSSFVEVDDAIIKPDEFEPFSMSLTPPILDTSVLSDRFNFDKLKHYFQQMNNIFDSVETDDSDSYDSELNTFNQEDEFESLLAMLAPIENDNYTSAYFNFDGIKEHLFNCSKHHNRTKDDTFRDINEMINIGLVRGDFRKDQLGVTASDGAQRIVELAYWYKIPLRSAPGEKIRLQSDTLTFVRAIACFPHLASMLLFKTSGFAKNGATSVLASEQLPDAMKHSGFPGLIPKCCDAYLMKAYLFAHTAYMVDFGKLINPDDERSLKAIALNQLDYAKAGVEKVSYDDEFRVGILRAVGLTDAGVFKKIVDVCNNLCKEVGEPELTWETAEKDHIKNNVVCFFEDESKDVAAGEKMNDLADKLKEASLHDSFPSMN